MKIRIKKLSLLNFKGLKLYEILFVNNSTNIYGDNATGKTTLMDAFLWLLFGKDSTDRKDFEIKTLDHKGAVIPKIEHEVSAVIEVDGVEHTIKRILREKWQTKRGSKDAEFTGNETIYFWNDVPMQQKDYQAKINGLVNEDIFKLLTNVLYFNQLDWQKRRSVLTQIAGDITDSEIAATNTEFKALIDRLVKESKTMSDFKSQLSAQKKKLKDELQMIPTRIDEARRGMPEQIDFSAIEKSIAGKAIELGNIEDALLDASKVHQENLNRLLAKQNEVNDLKSKKQTMEFEIKQQFQNRKNERQASINSLQSELMIEQDRLNATHKERNDLKGRRERLDTEAKQLRDQWNKCNESQLVFKEEEFCCPTCKRAYETTDVEAKKAEMLINFNKDKTKRLAEIEARGKQIVADVIAIDNSISEVETRIIAIDKAMDDLRERKSEHTKAAENAAKDEEGELQSLLTTNSHLLTIANEITAHEQYIQSLQVAPADNTELKSQKAAIISAIDQLKAELASKEQIEKVNQRIAQLQEEESKLAQQVADLEGIEFTIQNFEKAKIEALEAKVNSMFAIVKFKMFETQINGGEVPCCHTMVNSNGAWVPFSDANNAARINAGLDIINRLSQHYNVQCPVFIDNRESVTRLIDSEAQLVNLIVSSEDKQLRVG
jgi:DNA repair protein SbcC/Rad50